MTVLGDEQINIFQDQGFILLENAIDTELLEGLQTDFNGWVKDSINHQQPYGEMLDGRPRRVPSRLRPATSTVGSS